MSPILDSIGSVKAFGWGSLVIPNSFESIATVSLSSNQTTISFNSIPSTYKHLQIRILGRSSFVRGGGSTLPVNMYMKIGNSGTIQSTNYSYHYMTGDGSSATAGGTANMTSMPVSVIPGANATASIFSATIIDILDYTSTTKNKTIRSLNGVDQNGSGIMGLYSAQYFGTPLAITDIELTNDANWITYSQAALYGIKA